MTEDITQYLEKKTYPGRGIFVFKPNVGDELWCAYWIMGRSENSRNRVFERYSADGVEYARTVAADESKCTDPHLIIYNPLIYDKSRDALLVTNGDQTDTVYNYVKEEDALQHAFFDALITREYEDDHPNFTPRISCAIHPSKLTIDLSILKKASNSSNSCARNFYHYDFLESGFGRLITTYVDDGSPLPSYSGDPIVLGSAAATFDDFGKSIWESLNSDNKISLLAVRVGGEFDISIVNRYEKV